MAYPTVDKPYGLLPINLIGGQVYAGATRYMPILSAYNTDLLFGDVVKRVANGTVEKDTGTATATPVGVFMGCTFTSPVTKQKVFSQYWPAGTVASDAQAIVADDPDLLFKVAVVSGTTVIAAAGASIVGNNAELVQNAGSTTTGDSAVAVSAFATTNTLPVRVIDIVPESIVTASAVGSTSGSSTTVTLTAANPAIKKFMSVSGTGIAAGTTVAAISGTTLTLSAAANLSSVALSFAGAQEVIVKWNFGMHQYETATGV